jgi:N-acetyl-gamma-glutamyl-phosphate reductase/acetylglutamate kinase
MLIAPLVGHVPPGVLPTVFGLSGYSGAGTVMVTNPDGAPASAPKVSPESLGGGVRPYALTGHIHEREAGHHLSRLLPSDGSGIKVAFVPSVAPWFSGIISTASIPLKDRLSAKEVAALFAERYKGEPLVRLMSGVPALQDIEKKHTWSAGGFQTSSEGDRVVVVVRFFLLPISPRSESFFRAGWTIC